MFRQKLTLAAATTLALTFALSFAGCGGDDKKPENKPAETRPAPQPQKSVAAPQPKPSTVDTAADDPPPAPIIMKGKKPKDGDSAGSTSSSNVDPAQQAQIDRLKEQAKASQGKDNGQPLRASDAPTVTSTAAAPGLKRDIPTIKADNVALQAKIDNLEAEKRSYLTEQNLRGRTTFTNSNPERTNQIDIEIAGIRGQISNNNAEVAAIQAANGITPGSGQGAGTAPQGGQPQGGQGGQPATGNQPPK